MPRGWEGNRRSGVALAMCHGLEWFIHLRAQRLRLGDEHPAYAPSGAWFPLPFTCRWVQFITRQLNPSPQPAHGGKEGHTYLRPKVQGLKRRGQGLRLCDTEGVRGVCQADEQTIRLSRIIRFVCLITYLCMCV